MSRAFWASAAVVVAVSLTPGVAVAASGKGSRSAAGSGHSDRRGAAVLLAPGAGFGVAAGSPAVRAVQRTLVGVGISPGPLDGRYGPLTTAAVARFQRLHGLAADGIVGPHTRRALASGWLFEGAGYLQPRGSSEVRSLQRRLARAGFSPGPPDGRYGPLTTQAVKRFQHAHRLAADGITGTRTQHALRANPKPGARTPQRPTPTHPRPHHPQTPRPGAPPAPRPNTAAPHHRHGGSIRWPIAVALGVLLIAALALAGLTTRRRGARAARDQGPASGPPAGSPAPPAPATEPAPQAASEQPAAPLPQPAAPLPQPAAPLPQPAAPPPPPAPTNGDPDRPERVKTLQRQLTTLGFRPGPIDGRYGPHTTQAVQRFQTAHELKADGIVGPLTADALRANAPQPPTNGRIERVKALQRQLSWLGYEPGPADGNYGPLTTGAVKRFQQAHDLPADGIVDPATADTLKQTTAQRPTNDRTDRVKALQRQLDWLGLQPGPIDGRYGPQTTEAVKRFQEQQDLPPDGIVNPTTQQALQQTVSQSAQW
jgi:peptidoglycan hydrolase-like protein with peptidoglycan-binding domain